MSSPVLTGVPTLLYPSFVARPVVHAQFAADFRWGRKPAPPSLPRGQDKLSDIYTEPGGAHGPAPKTSSTASTSPSKETAQPQTLAR